MNSFLPITSHTPLRKIQPLCNFFGQPNLLIKDESVNPTGTHKDRRSQFIIKKATELGVDKLVLITAGNSGNSLLHAAIGTGLQTVCIIDRSIQASIKKQLNHLAYLVIETDLSSDILTIEKTIAMAREHEREVIWDVKNGYHEAYLPIVDEIKSANPAYVITPVGSGELFVGIYYGLKDAGLKTKLIGIGVNDLNSIADKLHTPWTPYEKIIGKITAEGHQFIRLDEPVVKATVKQMGRFSLNSEASALVAFAAFDIFNMTRGETIVYVNSGKGLF